MPTTNDLAAPAATARASNSLLLSKGVARLETTLKLTTAILALAAGVYTYLGVRELLNGSPTTVFFAAVIYSVAVSVGIYAFWIFLMQFMPHVVDRTGRALMFGCMLLGSLMIVAMSSWLNASALAGAAAIQQHLAITVQNYTRDLDTANSNAIAAQGLVAGYPARLIAVFQTGRRRARRLAHGHRGLRHRRAASDANVRATRQPRSGGSGVRQARLGVVRAGRQASGEDARADFRPRADLDAQRCLCNRVAGAQRRDHQPAADFGGARRQARGDLAVIRLHRAGRGRPYHRSRGPADRRGRQGGEFDRRASRLAFGGRRQDTGAAARRTGTVPDHVARRSRASLRRRFHPELGGRDLDRPDAGGAGADPVRGARRNPARGASRLQCIRYDGGRTGRGVADGPRGRGSAAAWRRSRRSRLAADEPASPAPLRRSTRTSPRCRQRGTPNRPCHAAICNDPAARP